MCAVAAARRVTPLSNAWAHVCTGTSICLCFCLPWGSVPLALVCVGTLAPAGAQALSTHLFMKGQCWQYEQTRLQASKVGSSGKAVQKGKG